MHSTSFLSLWSVLFVFSNSFIMPFCVFRDKCSLSYFYSFTIIICICTYVFKLFTFVFNRKLASSLIEFFKKMNNLPKFTDNLLELNRKLGFFKRNSKQKRILLQ